MRKLWLLGLGCLLASGTSSGVSKPHVVSFGKVTSVKWMAGPDENKAIDFKIRALYVDGRLKEFTVGSLHEVTDRLFVVQRAFRLNDNLPEEPASTPHWRWERGGWLLVDRVTGRVTAMNLPEFDAYYSTANWYRDYVAYCGVSDDNKKLYAVVAQLGRRKPLLKKIIESSTPGDMPDSACPAPTWDRRPARVTFAPVKDQKFTYSVRGHTVDVVNNEEDGEDPN